MLCSLCCGSGTGTHIDIASFPVVRECRALRCRCHLGVVGVVLANGRDDDSPGTICGTIVEAGEACSVPSNKLTVTGGGKAGAVFEITSLAVSRGAVADIALGPDAAFLVQIRVLHVNIAACCRKKFGRLRFGGHAKKLWDADRCKNAHNDDDDHYFDEGKAGLFFCMGTP